MVLSNLSETLTCHSSKYFISPLILHPIQFSPSLRRRIDDEAPGEGDENYIEKKMTGGRLKTGVNDADVSVFGVLQICDKMEKTVGENILTMLKVSDGNCVSWQATAVPAELARIASLGKFALVEVTNATIHHGYRLIIEAFEDDLNLFH